MVKNLLMICFMLACYGLGYAQQQQTGRKTMTEHLRSDLPQLGTVRIFQNPLLDSLVAGQLRIANMHVESNGNEMFITGRGWRIQIFSGNYQRESKNEAYSKEAQIKALFPELDTYVTFQTPFWKLRVGNFRTSEEAHAMLRQLEEAFPKWKEMSIVRDIIKFPLNEPYLP